MLEASQRQYCLIAAIFLPRQHLPPLSAQLTDLVSHHTFLKLVLRGPGCLAGTTLQGCNLQNLLCKCKCEAQTVQGLRMLLLRKQ